MNTSLQSRRSSSSFAPWRVRAAGLVAAVAVLALLGMASQALAAPIPTFGVDSHGDGIQGSDWPTNTPTMISVFATEGASAPFFEKTVTADSIDPDSGGFSQYLGGPSGIDLQAGQKVVVHNSDTTKTTVVTPLTVTGVNLATNTVWGETDSGVGGDIQVWDHDELNSTFSDPSYSGLWSYDFTSSGGLQQGWGGSTSQTDADGDSTVADWHVPEPRIIVDAYWNFIKGEDWGLRDDVTVTVYPTGSLVPKATFTSDIDDNWAFEVDSEADIVAGDRVVATDGHTTKTLLVSPLAITAFNFETGVIHGVCTARSTPTALAGGIDTIGGGGFFSEPGGLWVATFGPVAPGVSGWFDEQDSDGDFTRVDWRAPTTPVAVPDSFAVIEDTALSAGLLGNDTYYGPSLQVSFSAQPSHGTVTLTPGMGTFDYRPAPGFSGTDTFRYRIADSTPWRTLWSDSATVTVIVRPWYLGYNSLTTTTIQLQWPDTADTLPDFDHYLVTDGGSFVAFTTSTTQVLDGLQSGSSHVFGVCMVDASGHESHPRNLTITMPQETASTTVEVTDAATADLVVQAPGSSGGESGQTATVTVVITDVTTGGQLTLVRTDAPPAEAPPTLRFLDEYFDLGFTGSFTGTVTISVPYDPRIPDSRALDLTLQHWASDHWENLATRVDLVKHTLTASVTSLSPIVVAEPRDAVTAAKIVLPKRVFYPAYGARATVTARLLASDLAATPLAGFTLVLERLTGASWTKVATLSAVAGSPGSYRASAAPVSRVRTVFRVRLTANALYTASSPAIYVVPHAKLTTPRPSKTSVTHGRTFYISGQVYPKRAMYVYVRIYRYSRGAYRYFSTSSRVKSTTSGSYRRSLKLNKTGSYKFKAYVGDDKPSATVARTYSALSTRVRVR